MPTTVLTFPSLLQPGAYIVGLEAGVGHVDMSMVLQYELVLDSSLQGDFGPGMSARAGGGGKAGLDAANGGTGGSATAARVQHQVGAFPAAQPVLYSVEIDGSAPPLLQAMMRQGSGLRG